MTSVVGCCVGYLDMRQPSTLVAAALTMLRRLANTDSTQASTSPAPAIVGTDLRAGARPTPASTGLTHVWLALAHILGPFSLPPPTPAHTTIKASIGRTWVTVLNIYYPQWVRDGL